MEHFTNNFNLTIQIIEEFIKLIKNEIGLELNKNKILHILLLANSYLLLLLSYVKVKSVKVTVEKKTKKTKINKNK